MPMSEKIFEVADTDFHILPDMGSATPISHTSTLITFGGGGWGGAGCFGGGALGTSDPDSLSLMLATCDDFWPSLM